MASDPNAVQDVTKFLQTLIRTHGFGQAWEILKEGVARAFGYDIPSNPEEDEDESEDGDPEPLDES